MWLVDLVKVEVNKLNPTTQDSKNTLLFRPQKKNDPVIWQVLRIPHPETHNNMQVKSFFQVLTWWSLWLYHDAIPDCASSEKVQLWNYKGQREKRTLPDVWSGHSLLTRLQVASLQCCKHSRCNDGSHCTWTRQWEDLKPKHGKNLFKLKNYGRRRKFCLSCIRRGQRSTTWVVYSNNLMCLALTLLLKTLTYCMLE